VIAGYHLIWTAYGYWLPNDPRGSTSQEICSAKIASLGELHYGRRKIQPAGHVIREFYEAAQGVLKHKLLTFTNQDVEAIACGFAEVIAQRSYTCYACAIMPDHIHLLIRKHRDMAEAMIAHLQEGSRKEMLAHPNSRHDLKHPVWGGPGWKVYLDSRQSMERIVRYVEQNPGKIGRPTQRWPFVKAYDGWLPGKVRVVRNRKRGVSDDC